MDMNERLVVSDEQMSDWRQICRAFAKREGAKLLFVNNSSMGLEYPDGSMKHVYIDEMAGALGINI